MSGTTNHTRHAAYSFAKCQAVSSLSRAAACFIGVVTLSWCGGCASGQMKGMAAMPTSVYVPVQTYYDLPYPQEARQQRVDGVVVLELHVGADGSVASIAVVSGHPLLTDGATINARAWEFAVGGVRRVVLVYDFTIDRLGVCADRSRSLSFRSHWNVVTVRACQTAKEVPTGRDPET